MLLLTCLLLLLCQISGGDPPAQSEQVHSAELSDAFPPSEHEPQAAPISPEEHDRRDLEAQESMAAYAKWAVFVSIAGLIASVIGLVFIVYSLRLNDDATRAAQDAVAEARRGNDIQNRAWLSVSCSIEDTFNGVTHQTRIEGLYLNVVCSVKNHGNAPALGVHLNAEADVGGPHRPDGYQWLADFGRKWISVRPEGTCSVFPGETVRLTHVVFLPNDVILAAAARNTIGAVFPYVVGCISYTYPTSSQKVQTRFCLSLASPGENGLAQTIIPTGDGKLTGVIGVCQPIETYAD